MSTQSDMWKLYTNRPTIPTFDPGLDVATVVFSHVQCVKTRVNLARVSKLWRDASKTAAAYPLRFDLDAFLPMLPRSTRVLGLLVRSTRVIGLMDNDEALSLPYERVVGLLGEEAANYVAEPWSVFGRFRPLWLETCDHWRGERV